MTSASTIWAPDAAAAEQREARINLALLRGVMENLRPNRLMIPLFAALACGMFSHMVQPLLLAGWYIQVVLSLVPQFLLNRRFPKGDLSPAGVRKWGHIAAACNLVYVLSWCSIGFWFWTPGNDVDHLLLQLTLAGSLASHAMLVGPSRQISGPAFIAYAIIMAAVPLQAHNVTYNYLSFVSLTYVGYISVMAKQHHVRARASFTLAEEKNSLLAELVMAKIESDRGRERAEAASLAKSQFLANMSHELRTPLNAILGFSELIAARMFKDEPERNFEYAGLINSSGHHLLALINDILDLAKIEAGRWKLEEGEIDLHRVAGDALQLVTWRAKDTGAALENAIPQDIAMLYADERAIKQILLNLLSNAVKFTPEAGHVTAFARLGEDGGMILGVTDTGVGIAAEDQMRVFDSFGQGKHDIAIADKGTGLGLAIVKGLTEAHGGHVKLESEVGKGTRVTVYLPASRVRARHRLQAGNTELAHFG